MATLFVGRSRRAGTRRLGLFLAASALVLGSRLAARAQQLESPPIVHHIQAATERLEMTANSSRMLTLDQKIPRAQVNNREIVELTPLSPNEIQVFAKKPGVTQINLWNEQNQIHTLDVMVFGDARELAMLIRSEFPHASIRVKPLAQSVVLSGFVDRQDHVSQIIRMAEDYYPKVISHITVGGVQQISLNVKVYEVSRTKLRTLGMDWSTSSGADFLVSSVSGLIDAASASAGTAIGTGGDTIRFGIIGDDTTFFGFIEALRRYDLMKVLAEPTLVTVSGRPAFFNSGGEFPIIIPQSLGTSSIEYKKFGTQIDFVPIVLGNGNIRLEVRPRVSEIDPTRSVTIASTTVPGLRVREVDTGVEMKPGQTLALAGLVQTRVEARSSGLPWLADLPYLGIPFRRNTETINEIELLVLVTPQVIEAVDCNELPPCRPGMHSVSPDDCDFYFGGMIEAPATGVCAPGTPGCQNNGYGGYGAGGLIQQEYGPDMLPSGTIPNGMPGTVMPGAVIPRAEEIPPGSTMRKPTGSARSATRQSGRPSTATARGAAPSNPKLDSRTTAKSIPPHSINKSVKKSSTPSWWPFLDKKTASSTKKPAKSASRYNPANPQDARANLPSVRAASHPGFIGPVGYDVTN
jgi:pilus assembly protein CpaC